MSHLWLPYTQMRTAPAPLRVAATHGTRLVLADGRELIDGIAAWWTACHGYNHPHIAAALKVQLETMPHVMLGGLVHEPAERLAARLAALLPGDLDRVFFSDSGSVAVEVALKMAVQYWLNRGQEGRTKFLAFRGGYHGDTLGAMSVCDLEGGMHARLRGYLPEQFILDLPQPRHPGEGRRDDVGGSLEELDSFLAAQRDRLAAVVVEPLVQAAGGMKFHEPATLTGIAAACARHDVLLIADEVMTGFGRTGSMFACAQAGIVPDIICLSKALTGGTMGLAATVARGRIFDAFLADDPGFALMHGPTFMANPLACAAAHASLDLFETEPRLAQVAAIAAQLAAELEPCRALPAVKDVRVRGAIGVVQLYPPVPMDRLRRRFPEEGVFIRPLEDVVYLTPAFTITPADLSVLTGAVRKVVGEISRSS